MLHRLSAVVKLVTAIFRSTWRIISEYASTVNDYQTAERSLPLPDLVKAKQRIDFLSVCISSIPNVCVQKKSCHCPIS
jgi:hypothetical protein